MTFSTIPDGTLDVAFASDVLEHVENPKQVAALICTKMKPGGRFIVCGPTENFV